MEQDLIYQLLIFIILLRIAYTDFRKFIIPNWSVASLTVLLLLKDLKKINFEYFLLPTFVLVFLILFRYYMTKRLNKESMGYGDIKLMTVLSFGLTTIEFISFIWISSLLALIVIKLMKQEKSPFGFYLSFVYCIFLFRILDETKILEVMSFTI